MKKIIFSIFFFFSLYLYSDNLIFLYEGEVYDAKVVGCEQLIFTLKDTPYLYKYSFTKSKLEKILVPFIPLWIAPQQNKEILLIGIKRFFKNTYWYLGAINPFSNNYGVILKFKEKGLILLFPPLVVDEKTFVIGKKFKLKPIEIYLIQNKNFQKLKTGNYIPLKAINRKIYFKVIEEKEKIVEFDIDTKIEKDITKNIEKRNCDYFFIKEVKFVGDRCIILFPIGRDKKKYLEVWEINISTYETKKTYSKIDNFQKVKISETGEKIFYFNLNNIVGYYDIRKNENKTKRIDISKIGHVEKFLILNEKKGIIILMSGGKCFKIKI